MKEKNLIPEDLEDTVIIRKDVSLDPEYTKAVSSTLSEWNSKNDENAYRDL